MRILLADDEPVARKRLEHALQSIPQAEIVGQAINGGQAIEMIRTLKPDVALLDIQMPGCSGISVAASVSDSGNGPELIFVTAYDRHAVRAFDLHAADYLLKPVSFERLERALRRADARLRARASDQRLGAAEDTAADPDARDQSNAIWIREGRGLTRLDIDHIDRLEAAGDYVIVHCPDTTHIIKGSIGGLEQRLNPAKMMRIHRSSIVHIGRIRSIRRRNRRTYVLLLTNGALLDVGPSYIAAVLERFGAPRWRTSDG